MKTAIAEKIREKNNALTIPVSGGPVQLPSIETLYNDDNMPVLQKASQFQVLVNQEPKKEWIRMHPVIEQPYIPIERIEWLLTNICVLWRVEIKTVQVIANSVVIAIRLHYYDWTVREWTWHDGVGAAPLQTDKGSGANNVERMKVNAVQIGAPAAETFAVKDAAEKIGKIFGKDLKRKEVISYDSLAHRYNKVFENENKNTPS